MKNTSQANSSLDRFQERLTALEREVRVWRRCGSAVLAVAGCLLLASTNKVQGDEVLEVIRAKRIEVIAPTSEQQGQVALRLDADGDGGRIQLMSGEGTEVFEVSHGRETATTTLRVGRNVAADRSVVSLSVTDFGSGTSAQIGVSSKGGADQSSVTLVAHKGIQGSVQCQGPNGQFLTSMMATHDGGKFGVYRRTDDRSVPLILADADESGSMLTAWHGPKKFGASVYAKGGVGSFMCQDADEQRRATLRTSASQAELRLAGLDDGSEKTTVWLGTQDGDGSLFVRNRDETAGFLVGAAESGAEMMVGALGDTNRNAFHAGSGVDGATATVYNKTGERSITLDVSEYGYGRVGVWDRKGKGRTLEPTP